MNFTVGLLLARWLALRALQTWMAAGRMKPGWSNHPGLGGDEMKRAG